MLRAEDAIRRAGALAALVAASTLVPLLVPAPTPAPVDSRWRAALVLATSLVLLLSCAAVLLSPARHAVARLARRAVEPTAVVFSKAYVVGGVRKETHEEAAAEGLRVRWLGFAGIALCVAIDVNVEKEAAAAASVEGSLVLFLLFLAGVWAVHLSMVTGKGAHLPAAAAEEVDGGEVSAMAPPSAHVFVDSKLQV